MRKKIIFLVFIIIISTSSAYANGGPTVIDSTGGYHIVPPDDNSIEISREDIVYNISDKIKDSEERLSAQVNIKYVMENTNTVTEEYSIAFPLNFEDSGSSLNDVKVNLDGEDIDVSVLMIEGPVSNLQFKDIVSELNKGNILKTSKSTNILRVAVFKVMFQPKTEHILEVSYNEHSRLIRKMKFLYNYSEWMPEFNYFLEPAKYWSSFKDLYITINVPDGYYIKDNSISGFEQTDNQFNYYSSGLPDANLKFVLNMRAIKKPIMSIVMIKSYRMFILIFSGTLIVGVSFLVWRHLIKNRNWKEKYRKL